MFVHLILRSVEKHLTQDQQTDVLL